MARPLTPKSERSRRSYGSLISSLQTAKGLCAEPRCLLRQGHDGDCWPKEAR